MAGSESGDLLAVEITATASSPGSHALHVDWVGRNGRRFPCNLNPSEVN